MPENMRPIEEVAAETGIAAGELEFYGPHIAKIGLEILDRLPAEPRGRLILVTGINPTRFGVGKTVTTIGLAQAIRRIGRTAIATLREPSLGPVFGLKGGATGGGRSQVLPAERINLHFTGDIHAVTAAHNLLAALVDHHLYRNGRPELAADGITWKRVIDMNDRALRRIVLGSGGNPRKRARESGFDITPASEVMSILTLASGLADLRHRLGAISIGVDLGGRLVSAETIRAAGAMAVLLREAIRPNLVQTTEGGPCLVHGGPFANISHGSNSVLADRIGLGLADYVVMESGFGSDCGAEKFLHIKCRQSGLRPSLAVLVVALRALRHHGGGAAQPASAGDEELIRRGCDNLAHHIGILRRFGLPVIVALNRFPGDTEAAERIVLDEAMRNGADAAVVNDVFARGGEGGVDLARAVVERARGPIEPNFAYETGDPIADKIAAVARTVYGADGIKLADAARNNIDMLERNDLGRLPICIAKTPLSLSHDPIRLGRPRGFTLPIEDIRPATGAGFLYPLAGKIFTMPGLPAEPAACDMDLEV